MAMIRLPQEFSEFLRLLNDREVEYLLVGGWAVGLYGHVRYTGDIDVWVATDETNANRVLSALADFGIQGPEIVPDLITEKGNILRFGVVPMKIEILTELSGVDFRNCYAMRETMAIDDIAVSVISLADLKVNKQASGRHKDLADLEELNEL
jgi:predicted nucleotidyltransferase